MTSLQFGNFAKPLGELGWPLWQADLGLWHPWFSLLHQYTLTFNFSVFILYYYKRSPKFCLIESFRFFLDLKCIEKKTHRSVFRKLLEVIYYLFIVYEGKTHSVWRTFFLSSACWQRFSSGRSGSSSQSKIFVAPWLMFRGLLTFSRLQTELPASVWDTKCPYSLSGDSRMDLYLVYFSRHTPFLRFLGFFDQKRPKLRCLFNFWELSSCLAWPVNLS